MLFTLTLLSGCSKIIAKRRHNNQVYTTMAVPGHEQRTTFHVWLTTELQPDLGEWPCSG